MFPTPHPSEAAFPNADPCRHGSMAEVKWTAWSVIVFLLCMFFSMPKSYIMPSGLYNDNSKIMELKQSQKETIYNAIWNTKEHYGILLAFH